MIIPDRSTTPMTSPSDDISGVLAQLRGASREEALEKLMPLLYAELRTLARAQLRNERPGHTLQTADLVHEAYLRLAGGPTQDWDGRRHFFSAAAEAMRRILIEHARRRSRVKRGGERKQVSLSDVVIAAEEQPDDLLALDDAIRRLEERDPRASEIVRLRFFAGLSVEETARALDISERTVKREWAVARAWLFDSLRDDRTD
jgi:RNA polymerase sigma-70 factor (ECF subfamily)